MLSIPIRRISRFDIDKNQDEIATLLKNLEGIEKNLKNIRKFAIHYLQNLIKKYGSLFPRRTHMKAIEEIDKRAMSERTIKVGYDPESGFIGTKVSSETSFDCSNLDKLLLLFADGMYKVISIPEKQYVHTKGAKVIWLGQADKKTVINLVYTDQKRLPYAKRFVVKQFILDKEYSFLDPDQKLEYITSQEGAVLELHFKPKPRQKKMTTCEFAWDEVAIKGVSAKGVRIANKELLKVKIIRS